MEKVDDFAAKVQERFQGNINAYLTTEDIRSLQEAALCLEVLNGLQTMQQASIMSQVSSSLEEVSRTLGQMPPEAMEQFMAQQRISG